MKRFIVIFTYFCNDDRVNDDSSIEAFFVHADTYSKATDKVNRIIERDYCSTDLTYHMAIVRDDDIITRSIDS